MKSMTISCLPDGSVQHTLKDSFFRPFEDSPRQVERMSEILFDEDKQGFYVHMIKEVVPPPDDGSVLGKPEYAVSKDTLNNLIFWGKYFDSYELAVGFEIEIIEDLRLKGYSFERAVDIGNRHRIDESVALPAADGSAPA